MIQVRIKNGRAVAEINPGVEVDLEVLGKFYAGNKDSGDYCEIQDDGSLRYYGDATVWEDIVGDIMSKKLYATTGKIDYDWDENAITFQPGGDITSKSDRLQFNIQYPHRAKTDGEFRFHLHYFQPDDTARVFTLKYRIQSNNSAKTTDWTTVTATCGTDDVFTYPGSGDFNQILAFPAIDFSGASISSTLQCMLARTDSLSDNVQITFADAHYEIDSDGSRTEYVK